MRLKNRLQRPFKSWCHSNTVFVDHNHPDFDPLIAVMALGVTGFLSDRNRVAAEAIAKQQARLRSQEQLASIREDFVSTLTHDLKTPLLGAIETLKSLEQGQFGAVTPTQQKVLEQ